MATSKLLKPTNVTISIPEFTDQPDQRVNSNGLDKEADAINALSEQIANQTTNARSVSLTGATNASGTLKWNRIGNIVFFYAIITATVANSGVNGMFSGMPASIENIDFICTSNGNSNNPRPYLQIRTDGGMRNYASINDTTYCSGVYFTA